MDLQQFQSPLGMAQAACLLPQTAPVPSKHSPSSEALKLLKGLHNTVFKFGGLGPHAGLWVEKIFQGKNKTFALELNQVLTK